MRGGRCGTWRQGSRTCTAGSTWGRRHARVRNGRPASLKVLSLGLLAARPGSITVLFLLFLLLLLLIFLLIVHGQIDDCSGANSQSKLKRHAKATMHERRSRVPPPDVSCGAAARSKYRSAAASTSPPASPNKASRAILEGTGPSKVRRADIRASCALECRAPELPARFIAEACPVNTLGIC